MLLKDLDSLCSALLLAYLRTYTPPHTLHIPLCHLHRDDLTLRPEFTEVLKRASVSPDDVLTLDELSKAAGAAGFKENTHWLLVDHNSLTGKLEPYKDRVVGCIDHHDDEGLVPQDSSPRVIEKSGSCASLVVNHCKEAWDELKSLENADEVDSQVAQLALGPILIDTNNLENKDKTTPFDEDAVQFLETKISGSANYDRASIFTTVSGLKENISPLSIRDVLRKDYKEWEDGGLKLGMSSVPADLSALQDKAGGAQNLIRDIADWGKEKDIDLVCVMTAFKKEGKFSRELLLLARSEQGVNAAKRFEAGNKDKLELSTYRAGELDAIEDGKWRKCWSQARVENSRKQVAPILREAMGA
ncbi:hypothetical protein TruAng_011115 [Truncatella angustata]|nr:hypothetical protein TruAng_011115 [Truncatella angustata]